jgi:hypothetical protein
MVLGVAIPVSLIVLQILKQHRTAWRSAPNSSAYNFFVPLQRFENGQLRAVTSAGIWLRHDGLFGENRR